jgi:hypothetical protein
MAPHQAQNPHTKNNEKMKAYKVEPSPIKEQDETKMYKITLMGHVIKKIQANPWTAPPELTYTIQTEDKQTHTLTYKYTTKHDAYILHSITPTTPTKDEKEKEEKKKEWDWKGKG